MMAFRTTNGPKSYIKLVQNSASHADFLSLTFKLFLTNLVELVRMEANGRPIHYEMMNVLNSFRQ